MSIKGFPENARISFIGSIFKNVKNKDWNINLGLENKTTKKKFFKHARFSNMHLIARRRCLNPTSKSRDEKPLTLKFRIADLTQWNISNNVSTKQFQFSQKLTDLDQKFKNTIVHLPQLELARALFFHNAYFARSALSQNFLSLEFDVQTVSENHVQINVIPPRNFPLSQFDHPGMRNLLAWILINPEIRKSYESIAYHFFNEKIMVWNRECWYFNFDPPSLANVEITVQAYYCKKLNQIYINEITEIKGLESKLPDQIDFYSPEFVQKENASSTAKSGTHSCVKESEFPKIDDGQEANSDRKIHTLTTFPVLISFSDPVLTRKVYNKKGSQNASSPSEEEQLEDCDVVGTDEASIDGTIGRGEFEGLNDESNNLQLFMERFEAFKFMMEKFAGKHDITMTPKIHKLPKLRRSKLHITSDGNIRTLLEFRFELLHKNFSVFEIDVTDNRKKLSTLILRVNDTEQLDSIIEEMTKKIVQLSLRWPTLKSFKNYGMAKTLHHPKNLNELNESSHEFKLWVERFDKIIKELLQKLEKTEKM
ncbi:Tn7-like element transposition protein TnsE [Acinetobacter sp. ANC 4862]|uniref:Tn7-like element transposition protein TnsE n=1 Tax=Acinetobacter sp. ANC 4862 TaxID=2529849 RepID=UPI00103AD6AD|nr:Tn7-like element transposition protein TnsE [Acinetobacter sp. ANC 4862]TCH63416.1 transposase [Acinetobacter sp. ANC 4862]